MNEERFELCLNSSPPRLPEWLHIKIPKGKSLFATKDQLHGKCSTICQEGNCPNRLECFHNKTATFLICGPYCTRSCAFCSVKFCPKPPPPDEKEAEKIVSIIEELHLCHAVITMTSRDDLEDKGASHPLHCVNSIRSKLPQTTIEILTSDFDGKIDSWEMVRENNNFEIFNHNLETTRRLTGQIRHKAEYDRSLKLLSFMKEKNEKLLTKSGFMVGFGETKEEVINTLKDLKNAGCDIVIIGQYLRSHKKKIPPKEYVPPEIFQEYASIAKELLIPHIVAAPFARSSYNASSILQGILKR